MTITTKTKTPTCSAANKIIKLICALLPFAVFGLMYFSMKFFPSYEYNDIDIRGLYEAEKSIFGFIPCVFFSINHNTLLDIIAGVSYFCWVPLPIAFAIMLFYQKKTKWCAHFTLNFLLCNIIGFCIYYAHPAAPPWYVMKYGFDLQLGVPGNVGGLLRFDHLIGVPLFQSIYSGNSNVFAAIPSLHAAYMLIATIYAILSRQHKITISIFALVTVGIWFTAVYSGHHYVIDVLLGIATAIVAVLIFEQLLMRIPLFGKWIAKYEKTITITQNRKIEKSKNQKKSHNHMTAQPHNHTTVIILTLLFICSITAEAQPAYRSDIQKEKLNRGLVAVKTSDGKVMVSWRSLSSDSKDESFDVCRNGIKLNSSPLCKETCFIDNNLASTDATYTVTCSNSSINGEYTLKANAPIGYLPISVDKPEGGITPDGRRYQYEANDCSAGDADGDGEMEIFLKWYPTNARDNAHDGFTGPTIFDCYKLNGTRLWRINLGKNVRSGAHYIQFLVYDFDGDGSTEMICKTADGTIDGIGKVIGDSTKDYRFGLAEVTAYYNEHKDEIAKDNAAMEQMSRLYQNRQSVDSATMSNMRKMFSNRQRPRFKRGTGRILEGPEYLTVFSGKTGEALCTIDYVPERGRSQDWGDDNANRCDRYLACVAYLDGIHPSAVMCRGYYTRAVLAAFDWDGTNLKQHWVFDSNDKGNKHYAGQGNHNLRVADVDADGCDEIIYGSCAIDHNGTGLYSTRMGHGDAMHLMPFYPDSKELQVWDCHENHRDGASFRDARTGKVIFQTKCSFDNGRCMAADIDPTNEGVEMWSLASEGIYNVKGEQVGKRGRLPVNFAVWWDGDLLREMLDRSQVSKYDWQTGEMHTLARFEGTTFNNGTKQNPCLSGDIIGDWREEVLTRTTDSNELRLYISDIPTTHRITTLLNDIPYRLSIAYQNTAYNQPPEVGFYLGEIGKLGN